MISGGAEPPRNRWFVSFGTAHRAARVRLLALPFGGGAASAYRLLPAAVHRHVEITSVQLPGRENRHRETPFEDMTSLVEELVGQLETLPPLPLVIMGSSMGALIAFEVAKRVEDEGMTTEHLIVVACRSPDHTFRPLGARPALVTDSDIAAYLIELGGTALEVVSNPDLMNVTGSALRADASVCASYRADPDPKLGCPITAYSGDEDPTVPRRSMESWQRFTTGPFTIRTLPGDHFLLANLEPTTQGALATDLPEVFRSPSRPDIDDTGTRTP